MESKTIENERPQSQISSVTQRKPKESQLEQAGSKQFFCLVRHSQRADDPTMAWELKKKQEEVIIECDPQLSRPNGKDQAK